MNITNAIREAAQADPGLLATLVAGRTPTALRRLRKAAADRIDGLMGLLDAIDGDPDLEPSLGFLDFHINGDDGRNPLQGAHDDREQDDADDGEPDVDGEAALGWPEHVGQIRLGEGHEDGDNTAPERAGAGFVRSGSDDRESSFGWRNHGDQSLLTASRSDREEDAGDQREHDVDLEEGDELDVTGEDGV